MHVGKILILQCAQYIFYRITPQPTPAYYVVDGFTR